VLSTKSQHPRFGGDRTIVERFDPANAPAAAKSLGTQKITGSAPG
jgi:hypothetical protein